MLKMVDGTGIIGVDMICPLGVSTPQPPNYDRVELEGTGMLVLPNSLDAPLERLELGGKTEQVTTRGVNLFDASLAKSKENYEDVTINGAIIRAIELDLKPNTKYAFQCVIRSVSTTMNVGNSTIRYVVSDGQKRVITTNEDGKLYVGFTGNVDSEIGKIGVSIVDIQVEEGDTQTAYEPYTGGKPSPSPEYPQEIKNSGKWNEEKQKYEVSVKVTGKNLFDMNKFIDTCNFTKNEDGTFIIDKYVERYDCFIPANTILSIEVLKVEDSSGAAALELFYEDGKSMCIGFGLVGVKTFLIQKDVAYIKVLAYRKHEYKYIQLEKGRTATPYEPYKEQSLTLTSDRPFTKWDRLVEQGGQIGWLYGSKIYVVTGNEVFESRDGYNIESYTNRYFILNDLLMENDALKPLAYMKCLRNVQYVYSANIFEEGFETNKNQFHIKLSNDRVGILASDDHAVRTAKFSEYMKKIHKNGNPIEILYATTDTVFLPLPQEEQNAIRALKTYYPTTVITVDGGELYPDIKVTYRKEI